MLKTIIWYFKFMATLFSSTGLLLKAKKLEKAGQTDELDRFAYGIAAKWAKNRVSDSGANITVHNAERIPQDRNVLFVSNHQSNFDIAIFLAAINKDTGFVAKIELEKIPLLRSWMRCIHCVFMDRSDIKQSMQTIIKGIEILKKGYTLTVFPEGTRSLSDKMGDFKPGSFKLALKSKVPVVPVTIDGSYKILEANGYKISPENVNVYIHEPIYTDNLSKEEITDLPEKVKVIIQSKLPCQIEQ